MYNKPVKEKDLKIEIRDGKQEYELPTFIENAE
jgi:hypothetical protein